MPIIVFLDRSYSVYADYNTEPLFRYQFNGDVDVELINIVSLNKPTDLVAFVDCSTVSKSICGSHRVDKLYGIEMNSTIFTLVKNHNCRL